MTGRRGPGDRRDGSSRPSRPSRPSLRVAAVQDGSVDGDVPANVERHVAWIERAADDGAALAVFPELSVIGYDPDLIDLHRMRVDPSDSRLDPIRAAWDADDDGPRPYAAGTWGPAASSALIARDGFAWRDEQ